MKLSVLGKIAVGFLAFVCIGAFVVPFIFDLRVNEMNASRQLLPPSFESPFGTDQFGRDIFKRVLVGGKNAFIVAFFSAFFSVTIGSILGSVAAFAGGALDVQVSRLADLLFSIPDILLALVLMAILGAGTGNLILALSIVYTPIFIRVSRSAVLSVKESDYVCAARVVGATDTRILVRHITPNVWPLVFVQASLTMAFALLAESSLSFIGFGVEPGSATWGLMLSESKDWLSQAWWPSVFPGLALTLSILSLNLLGYELGDKVR